MRVILVVDETPERIRFFEIEDPTDVQKKMLEEANGKYYNSDDLTEAMEYLDDALADPEWASKPSDYAGIWKDKEVGTPVGGPIDRVYHFGFCM